jgi:hypothetical protein
MTIIIDSNHLKLQKLGILGSILGLTSTQGLKITEEKELPLHKLTSVNG